MRALTVPMPTVPIWTWASLVNSSLWKISSSESRLTNVRSAPFGLLFLKAQSVTTTDAVFQVLVLVLTTVNAVFWLLPTASYLRANWPVPRSR